MTIRLLTALLIAGFAHGAFLYGAPVSLLHVATEHIGTPRDAVVLLGWLVLLYGTISAGVFVVAGLPCGLARWRRGEPAVLQAGVSGGFAAFSIGCWFFVMNYGLTYDEIPLVKAPGRTVMLVYLGLRTLLVVAVALTVAGPLARWWLAWSRPRRLREVGIAALVILALHVAAPLWSPAAPSGGGGVAVTAVSPDARSAARPDALRVVLVGIDGADWRVILPLIEKGRLPNFADLMRSGSSGPLATLRSANSASIWASIYTGQSIAHHGVEDFYRIQLRGMRDGFFPVHRTYLKELVSYLEPLGLARRAVVHRRELHAPPLWEVLDRAGVSVGVVNGYYYSYPAYRPRQPESYVLAYGLDDAFARAGGNAPTGVPPDYLQPPNLLAEVAPVLGLGEFHWQAAATLRLLDDRRRPRLVSMYTREPDVDQHRFWKWYEPERYLRVDPAEVARLGDHIPRLYEEIDAFLGALRARLDERTVLMVISDHGHSPTLLHAMQTQHRHGPPGIILMAGGPVRPGMHLEHAHVLDVFPTVLYLLGRSIPEDGEGHVLVDALAPAFVAQAPVQIGASYNGPAEPPAPEVEENPRRNDDEIEKLRALGYVR